MEAELERFVWTLVLSLAAGAAVFPLRQVLVWRLRQRLPTGLVPQQGEVLRPDGMSRILSLIGVNAKAAEKLGTLTRWWFGRTTRKWRDLDAVVERRGRYLDFHFRDGTVLQAHKYVVGYAALREKADAVLREV